MLSMNNAKIQIGSRTYNTLEDVILHLNQLKGILSDVYYVMESDARNRTLDEIAMLDLYLDNVWLRQDVEQLKAGIML